MSEPNEERRIELATAAAGYTELEDAHRRAKDATRSAIEVERERAFDAAQRITELKKAAGAIGGRMADARKADLALLSEFVDRDLVMAESTAKAKAWSAELMLKHATRDLSVRQVHIEKVKAGKMPQTSMEKALREMIPYEMRLAETTEKLKAAEDLVADSVAALTTAWDEARRLPDGAPKA